MLTERELARNRFLDKNQKKIYTPEIRPLLDYIQTTYYEADARMEPYDLTKTDDVIEAAKLLAAEFIAFKCFEYRADMMDKQLRSLFSYFSPRDMMSYINWDNSPVEAFDNRYGNILNNIKANGRLLEDKLADIRMEINYVFKKVMRIKKHQRARDYFFGELSSIEPNDLYSMLFDVLYSNTKSFIREISAQFDGTKESAINIFITLLRNNSLFFPR